MEQKPLTFDFPRLLVLQKFIGSGYNSKLSSCSLLSLLELKIKIDEALTHRNKVVTELMNANGIKAPHFVDNSMRWVYSHLSNVDQINEALDRINRNEYTIDPVKFMNIDEFNSFTSKDNNINGTPLTIEQIGFLSKYLLKK